MDNGRIIEDNNPYILLKEENSYFSKLVQQTGHIMANRLHDLAKENFNNKKCDSFIKTKSETVLRQRNVF